MTTSYHQFDCPSLFSVAFASSWYCYTPFFLSLRGTKYNLNLSLYKLSQETTILFKMLEFCFPKQYFFICWRTSQNIKIRKKISRFYLNWPGFFIMKLHSKYAIGCQKKQCKLNSHKKMYVIRSFLSAKGRI